MYKKSFLNIIVIVTALTLVILFSASPQVFAKVRGTCSSCHTMHNSQGGDEVALDGPEDRLTVSSCVGCHSSASSLTVSTIGSSALPIVNNSSQPDNPLAGGNFYWMVNQSNHTLGHNVEGIATEDSFLDSISGKHIGSNYSLTISNCLGCHEAFVPYGYPGIPFTIARTGNVLICRDCHTQPKHHADDSDTVVDGDGGWYRFIYGVKGIEDNDWQKTVSASDHNEYQGELSELSGSISDRGCACHSDFHALRNPSGVGTGSPWLRHPVDVALPEDGEYAAYTAYNPEAPVARPDLSGYSGPSAVVTPGTDQVMCISCHRAHGSDQPDMLRWDYGEMNVNNGENNTGCFICHTTKDDGA